MRINRSDIIQYFLSILFLLLCFHCTDRELNSRSNPYDPNGDSFLEGKLSFADAGNDTTISINDLLILHAGTIELFNSKIVQIEWDINNTGFKKVESIDTSILAPPVATQKYACILKIIDDYNFISLDTMYAKVIQDPPIATAYTLDSIVVINSPVRLKGTATDVHGSIVKWEWDEGNNGDFIETTPDSNFTTIAPFFANNAYPYVLRVTDDDGNIALDTVTVCVLGEPFSTVTLPPKLDIIKD